MKRAIFVVLDGLGVGALPDAARYGDQGADTLGNVSRHVGLRLPFLERMGLGNIAPVIGVPPVGDPESVVGRLAPRSVGKDTTVGHWEHMGLASPRPFPTYPNGFPDDVVKGFTRAIGRGILGNRPASGTAILAELGEEHVATGRPIVYTSADSVFQVAAHVDVVPLETLYSWCEAARNVLTGDHAVARVIARPFAGKAGAFTRTKDRRDFSLAPPGPTYLDLLTGESVPVLGLGKVGEIFAGRGVSESFKVGSNQENLSLVRDLVTGTARGARFSEGLVFTNLVDFDMIWGHRNDVEGFAGGLQEADRGLREIADGMKPSDMLLVTADHGVDPTTPSTDHSREYVPVLVLPRPACPGSVYEGEFADCGATIYEHLTGQEAELGGRAITRLRPRFGWRRYTPTQGPQAGTLAGSPGRVGPEEAEAAARWLRINLGVAPRMAIILGSGLSVADQEAPMAEVTYGEIPHWVVGSVEGHPHQLKLAVFEGTTVAVLQGRVHEYEGFDVSEVQLTVRSLRNWGVQGIVLTSASGAVAEEVTVGSVVAAHTVLDFAHRGADGEPEVLPGTAMSLVSALREAGDAGTGVEEGVHASVLGPHYETPAELEVLRAAGVATVSMSPACELRAAQESGMEVAVVVVVTNVDGTSHSEVLEASRRAREALVRPLESLARIWS